MDTGANKVGEEADQPNGLPSASADSTHSDGAGSTESATEARVIKRYANRKLYDTYASRYVTLQQIAELVRGGTEVSIIDNTTKEDLTNVTLAQIVYESEKNGSTPRSAGSGRAPQATLKTLIQKGGELITTLREQPAFNRVSEAPVVKLFARREEIPPPPAEPVVEEDAKSDAREKRSMVASSREAIDELQRAADDRIRALMATAMGHVQHLQGEVRRLQSRIDVLEARLRRRGDTTPPPPGEPAGEPSEPEPEEP